MMEMDKFDFKDWFDQEVKDLEKDPEYIAFSRAHGITEDKHKALRKYFHGLTDERFAEIITEYPLSNILSAMDDYALHIAEQAVREELSEWDDRDPISACESVLSRIKHQTNEDK